MQNSPSAINTGNSGKRHNGVDLPIKPSSPKVRGVFEKKKCKGCGISFLPTSPKHKYCLKCRVNKQYYHVKGPTEHICLNCGEKFMSRQPYAKWCTIRCRNEAHGTHIITASTCPQCGHEFTRTTIKQIYCSNTCRLIVKAKRDAERIKHGKDGV